MPLLNAAPGTQGRPGRGSPVENTKQLSGNSTEAEVASSHCQTVHEISPLLLTSVGMDCKELIIYIYIYALIYIYIYF